MNTWPRRLARLSLLTSATAVVAIAGALYATQDHGATQAAALTASPPVPVMVRTLAEQKIRVWSDFSARLHAVDSAEIRPEVSGRITAVLFEDGQAVKAGDVLFIIDPRPFEASAARAEANLATAQTNAGFAKVEFDRAAGLMASQAIAQRLYDERANANRVAVAAIRAAEADLKQAKLDLEHAHVRAPITGRASRAEITLGNLVQAGPAAPLLTTIVANQTIYAEFEVDEQTYLESVSGFKGGRDDERRIPVQLTFPGDRTRSYQGAVYSFDNRINVSTGTIRARAKFDNADGALAPGMFATIRLANGAERNELLIPNRAVGFDQSKKFVLVVGPDDKVAYREVELGKQVAAQRIALKGVAAGDRVIVDGLQHVRPDMSVAPKEAPAADQALASAK